jgi:dipeptidyl-peptidase-4
MWPVILFLLIGFKSPIGAARRISSLDRQTQEDYARAERLDRKSSTAMLRNGNVIPHWIGKRDEFWYRRDTVQGFEFVLVDAATGRAQPAFDHKAVAGAIGKAIGVEVPADNLPFSSFTFSESRDSIRVMIKGNEYDCQLKPVMCKTTPEKRAAEGVLVSPDARWGVLTRSGNLILRDMQTGGERPLTRDGEPNFGYGIYYDGWKAAFIPRERADKILPPFESYWSPDSCKVIVPRVDQRHVTPYPFLETVPHDGSFRPKVHMVRIPLVGEKPATLEWFVFEIPSGGFRRFELPYEKLLVMQQDMLAVRKTWWSPNNSRLYAVAFGDNMESAFFFDIDLATAKVRTVVEEHLKPRTDLNSTSYNPPNVRVTRDGKEVIWFSQRDGWGHLYLYDGQTGRLKNQITKGAWLVRDIIQVDEARRRIYFTGGGREGGNPYYRYLYKVDFDGSNLKLLSPEKADHMLTSPWNDVLAVDGATGYEVVSPSGEYVVYNYSTPAQPTETIIRATEDGRQVAIFERADASALFAAGYQVPEEFIVRAADGKSNLWCLMYKPSTFDPKKRYPVIDVEYASPLTAAVPRNFLMALNGPSSPSAPASYAELGCIAVCIDARGTTFRSREFSQAGYGKLNINGLDDHVAAIKQLGNRCPYVDVNRVGIIGRSYGGWSALRAMLEFPDFFKVGVAGAPLGSMHNQYLDYHWTAFHGRPNYSNGTELRPSPAEVPKTWNVLDSRQQAARLKGKLLIVLGELDENVLPGSTLQLTHAFMKANKDFDLIYLPDQNHYFTGNPYVTRRVWDFLVLHLLGTEPPEDYQIQSR